MPIAASVAVGRLVATLRKEHPELRHLSTDKVGTKLGIGGSTLRMLEAGAVAPPVTIAYGLVKEFGLEVLPTHALIALAINIDRHESSAGRVLAASTLGKADKRVQFFTDAIRAAQTTRNERAAREILQSTALIDQLKVFVRLAPTPAPGGSLADRLGSQLLAVVPPLFLDVMGQLAKRLSDFPPHVNQEALNEWETKNEKYLRRFFTYLDDPELLIESAQTFHWAFLFNDLPVDHKVIVVSPNYEKSIAAVDRLVRALASKAASDDYDSLRRRFCVLPLEKPALGSVHELLWFDFVTRRVVGDQLPQEALDSTDRYRRFNNILLYDLNPAPDEPFTENYYCAFLDNATAGDTKPRPSKKGVVRLPYYSVALNGTDTGRIRDFFAALEQQAGPRQL